MPPNCPRPPACAPGSCAAALTAQKKVAAKSAFRIGNCIELSCTPNRIRIQTPFVRERRPWRDEIDHTVLSQGIAVCNTVPERRTTQACQIAAHHATELGRLHRIGVAP